MDKDTVIQKLYVKLEHLTHQAHRCIALRFPYDTLMIAAAKHAGAKWSNTHRCWWTTNRPEHLKAIFAAFKGVAWVDMNGLRKNATASPAAAKTTKPQGIAPLRRPRKGRRRSSPAESKEAEVTTALQHALQHLHDPLVGVTVPARWINAVLSLGIMLDWHQHIVADPQVMYGKPCIKGTRIPVDLILDKLAAGQTIEDLLEGYPQLTLESIQACLRFGADSIRNDIDLPFAS